MTTLLELTKKLHNTLALYNGAGHALGWKTEKVDKLLDESKRVIELAEQPAQQEPFKWSIYEADGTHHNKPSQKQHQPLTWLKVIETPGGWGKFVEAKPHEKGAKPVYTSPPAQRKPLTDEECDRIYTALDQWAREFDQYEFGLPTHCGDGMIGGRAIIRAAHGIKEST